MAEQIAGATLAELPGIDHAYWIDGGKVILDQIERFLTGRLPAHEPERMLATVLFADIVGSTEWVAKLGDGPWRELLGTFHRKVREVLQQYRGREINTTGDGFLVAFDGPARAVRCAAAIRDAVHPLGLEVRCGLHTGECEIVGNDLAGIAVHIGARVGGLAGPGEVLVSQTVRDLVAGSGLAFEPCGTHVLKGVPSEWRLFRAVAPLSTPRKSRRRCTPESGHGSDRTRCSLSANSRRRSAIRLPRRRMKGIHGDLKQFTRRGRRLAPHCRTDTSFNLGDSLRFASRPVSASLHAGLKIRPTNCLLAVFYGGLSATRRRRDFASGLASATSGTSFAAAVVQPNFVCPTFLNTVIEAPLEIAGPTSRATTARPSIGSACHRHTDYRGQHWRHRQK
jgi:class 3 adenylate cyclase